MKKLAGSQKVLREQNKHNTKITREKTLQKGKKRKKRKQNLEEIKEKEKFEN